MQILVRLLVFFVALFFAVGAAFAWTGKIEANTYIVITGIIGSIASVVGLAALGSPRLTAKDLRSVEAELFNTVAEQLKAAKDSEEKLATNKEELSRLERERAEVELLVRQASLKVFMEERLRNVAVEVENRLSADTMLSRLFDSYNETLVRVTELNGAIIRSPRADLINQILVDTERHERSPIYVRVMGMDIDIRPFIAASRDVISAAAKIASFH
jgi:hypothetical protein